MFARLRVGGVLALLALAGCGVKGSKVHGEVAFPDGKPLTAGIVVFERIHDDPAQRTSFALPIGADGTFAFEAPPGKYRAMVQPAQKLGGVEGSARIWPFDEKLGAFETSGLQFTVSTDEKANHFKIEVTPP